MWILTEDKIEALSQLLDHTSISVRPWLSDAIDIISYNGDCDLEEGGDLEPDDFGEEDDYREDDDPGEECPGDYPDTGFRLGYGAHRSLLIEFRGRKERIHDALRYAHGWAHR